MLGTDLRYHPPEIGAAWQTAAGPKASTRISRLWLQSSRQHSKASALASKYTCQALKPASPGACRHTRWTAGSSSSSLLGRSISASIQDPRRSNILQTRYRLPVSRHRKVRSKCRIATSMGSLSAASSAGASRTDSFAAQKKIRTPQECRARTHTDAACGYSAQNTRLSLRGCGADTLSFTG